MPWGGERERQIEEEKRERREEERSCQDLCKIMCTCREVCLRAPGKPRYVQVGHGAGLGEHQRAHGKIKLNDTTMLVQKKMKFMHTFS